MSDDEKALFKSWKEEYDLPDVDKALEENGLAGTWKADCIAGDGDLILRCVDAFQIIDIDELVSRMKPIFNPKSWTLDIGSDRDTQWLSLTLSWNN